MFTGEFEESSQGQSGKKIRLSKQGTVSPSSITDSTEITGADLPISIGGIGMNISFINLCLFSLQVNVSHGGDSSSIEVNDELPSNLED